MKRSGLSLVEVVVAIGLASVITVMLYQSLAQTNRTVLTIDVLVENYSDMALYNERLYKDLMGAYVPLVPRKEKKPKKSEPESQKKSQPEKEKKEKQPRKRDLFVMENFNTAAAVSGSQQRFLSCITTNPLLIYGETKPRKVRVVYILVPDEDDKKLWMLKRYESPEMDMQKCNEAIKQQSLRGYTVLKHIRSFAATCWFAQDSQNTEEKKYERADQWHDNQRAQDKKNLLPAFVEISGTIADSRKKREFPFSCIIPIMADSSPTEKKAEASKPADTSSKPEDTKKSSLDTHHAKLTIATAEHKVPPSTQGVST